MIRQIDVLTIPHKEQRYDTCGDWIVDGDALVVYVSDTGNWRFNMAVATHEIVEALACVHQGITQKQVDDFDMNWKEHDELVEPGADPNAPYYPQHMSAMEVEAILSEPHMLDINPQELDEALDKLSEDIEEKH